MGIHCTIFLTTWQPRFSNEFPLGRTSEGADLARPHRAKPPTDLGRYCRGDFVEGRVGNPHMFRLEVLPQQPPLGASPFLGRFRGRKCPRALPHLTN
jgi:hypothetical protein